MCVIKNTVLIFSFVLITCCNGKKDSAFVESRNINNFSDIDYEETDGIPYFSEINKLPIGFSLGDFNDYNSILYLTESANVFPFEDENLRHFLTKEEVKMAFETYVDSSFTEPNIRRVQYFPYSRLITKSYVLLIINKRKNDSKGRNYEFDLRTYTFDGRPIDKFILAKWDDDQEIYYAGWIEPDMFIKREYSEGKIEFYEIMENGLISKRNPEK